MDKATLSKKSVLALERLAKKVGAKIVTPEGKRKTKLQLVNSIIMAERLGKKAPGLKAKKAPARKTLAGKPKTIKAKVRVLTVDNGRITSDEAKKILNHKGPVNFKATAHNKAMVKKEIDATLKKLREEYKNSIKAVK
jgi:hypothetical protein